MTMVFWWCRKTWGGSREDDAAIGEPPTGAKDVPGERARL
jgi:hypothetical protein